MQWWTSLQGCIFLWNAQVSALYASLMALMLRAVIRVQGSHLLCCNNTILSGQTLKRLSFYDSSRSFNKLSYNSRINYSCSHFLLLHLQIFKKANSSLTSCLCWGFDSYCTDKRVHKWDPFSYRSNQSILHMIEMNGLDMACISLAVAMTLTRLSRVKQPDVKRTCSSWVEEGRRWEWRVTAQHNPPSFQPLMRNPILRNWAPVGRKQDMKAP